MSVFQVTLNQNLQGGMDLDPSTDTSSTYGQLGSPMTTSKQRSVYVTGPNRIYRKLIDGATFTDCNYWKQYVSVANGGTADVNTAFLTIVSDDGSIYSPIASENTYPRVWDFEIEGGDTYEDHTVDILGDLGGYAVFTQISNLDSQAIKVKLNGSSSAIFDLAGNETQVFNAGELSISMIQFDNSTSGASATTVQVLASVKSVCNS